MQLILEIFRSEQAGDPYAFRFGTQEYVLRSEGGGAETATLTWDDALLQELEAVRLPGRDPEVVQRLGTRLRRFLSSTRFIEHESELAAASERGEPVSITLRLSAAELYALPWELLTLRASGQHLGELPGVLLRYVWPETSTAAPTPSPPPEGGRILLAWSAAAGAVPASEHQRAIARACANGHHPFDPAGDVLPNLSMSRLAERLAEARRAQRPISILHILCHGKRSGSGFGLGWDPDEEPGGSALVDAGRLRQLLAQHAGMVRTVVLCACDSANSGQLGSHLGSVAQALHRAGIQTVLASRFPLSVAGSVHFTESFYSHLLALPASLESAFLTARGRLRQESRSLDWASLQLYARPEDGDDTRPIVLRPYRGLESFQADHARFLFGREREREQTLASLEALRRANRPRFLVVAGASGTGKSSVILAGVIPALAAAKDAHSDPQPLRQALHQLTEVLGARARRPPLAQALETLSSEVTASSGGASGAWEWAVMRPGEAPLQALQSALSQRQDPQRPLLIVVDQFEEIFTVTSEPAVRQEFAQRLWNLSAKTDSISCIITLRVDFLGHCGELILDENGLRLDRIAYQEAHRIFVAQMEPEQLRDAIELPARAAGLTLTEGLAEQMIAEVAGEPGALPLLEYVLDLLWQRRQGRELTARSYKELGGVSGALEGNANRVLDALTPAQQQLARRLFLRLTSAAPESPGAAAEALQTSRRRTSLAELREHVSGAEKSAQAQFEHVLAAFVDARLLVRSEEGGHTLVEVAHEALLRRWERLRQWLNEDRQRLGELQELERWGAQWRTYGTLLAGSQLGYATQVLRKHPRDLGPALTRMVVASQRAARQRRIRLTVSVTVALAVLSALTIYARISKQHADRQSAIARSRALGMQAERQLERHSDLALLLAARAQQLHDEPDSHAALATALDKTRYLRTFLRGPKGRINSVAFSADGKLLAGAGADQELWLFDVNRGSVARRLARPGSAELNAAAFSADGRLLAAGSADGLLSIWELESPKLEPQTLRGAALGVKVQGIYSLDFSPDGKTLAAGVDDGRVLLYELATREPRKVPMPGHTQPVASVQFDRGLGRGLGQKIASSSIDGSALIWNAATGERVLPPLSGYQEYLSSLAFSPSAQLLAAGSVDHSVLMWDAATGQQRGAALKRHQDAVSGVVFSPDGRLLVSCSLDKTLLLWDAESGKPIGAPLVGHEDPIYGCALSPDGQLLASASDGIILLWDLSAHPFQHRRSERYQARVSAMDASPDGRLLAVGTQDGQVRFWDVLREQWSGGAVSAQVGAVNGVAFSPDGGLVVSVGADGSVALLDARKQQRIEVLPAGADAHSRSVQAVAYARDGATFATAGSDGKVLLWDARTRRVRTALRSQQLSMNAVAYSPSSQLVAAAGFGGAIQLWRVASRQPLCAAAGDLEKQREPINALSFSPDGGLLVAGGYDGAIAVWDIAHCPARRLNLLRRHTAAVSSLSFDPGSGILASGGRDRAVMLWDVRAGQPIGPPLSGHAQPISAVAFARDGLLVSGDDELLWRWETRAQDRFNLACARANRNLSLGEWRRYMQDQSYCRICAAAAADPEAPGAAPSCED